MSERDLSTLDRDWSNYWQGRTGTQSGAALVGVEKHPEIESFWREQVKDVARSSSVLDLCCGAGTVIKILKGMEFSNLTGADISHAAIDIVMGEHGDVRGVVTPADDMPFRDGEFDMVVSQYGFEYGDYNKVIPEIARILKPNGLFLSLSHDTTGAIHAEVTGQIAEMTQIRESGFVDAARALFTAAMKGQGKLSNAEISQEFRAAQIRLFPIAQRYRGLSEYLYKNTQSMYQQHRNYAFDDIMNWFDGIENDVERFLGRMTSMHDSAIDPGKMQAMRKTFKSNQINLEPAISLRDAEGASLGWVLRGQKSE